MPYKQEHGQASGLSIGIELTFMVEIIQLEVPQKQARKVAALIMVGMQTELWELAPSAKFNA